ncbi:MAG: stage II sporulation protein R [Eubacteriales bacterium]|nr:stage II sporulation protein R [Eubacteriales bacterium]
MKSKRTVILALLLLACLPLAACERSQVPGDAGAVRLHIVANSDSDADQAEKLRIRDMLMQTYAPQLGDLNSSGEAWQVLDSLKDEIADTTTARLKADGFDYTAQVVMGTELFPTRNYMGRVWPAGQYQAVKILLGQGDGANWWCVMYPPLCIAGTGGDVELQKYYDQIEKLSLPREEAPSAPVRSRLADYLDKEKQWDNWFARRAQQYLARLKGEQ